jgi:methyl-accepting chemotaxis protein
MLERFRIGSRLALGFGALLGAAALGLVGSVLLGRHDVQALRAVETVAADRIAAARNMREDQLALASAIRSAGLQTDGEAVNADVSAYREALKRLTASEAAFAKGELATDERTALEQAVALRKLAEPVVDEALNYVMALAGDEAAKVLSAKFSPIERRWTEQLAALANLQRERATTAHEEIQSAIDNRAKIFAVFMLVFISAGCAFAVAMTRSVTRPLGQATAAAARIADGDLSVRIDPRGQDEAAELLRSLQVMAQQLAGMVSAVRQTAESIDSASREITQGNQDLSSRTELQAASVQETSATLSEVTDMVARNCDNAISMRALADKTAGVASEGGRAMDDVAQTMSRISESSRRIADIIGVIDGIAFQTNILALNAAVEAARAGEQGRGFAVVASEVRALAQRVSGAASEVRGLIGESVGRVEAGAQQIGNLGNTMRELVTSVEQVRLLVSDISTASTSQNASLASVNESVRAIDGSTQQNSALVEQMAAASHSLSDQTESLTTMVRRFRIA